MSISVVCYFGEDIKHCEDENVPTENDNKLVFVIVNDSLRPHELVMITRLIAIANAPELVFANDCAKKIAIIGGAMQCEDRVVLNDVCLEAFVHHEEPFVFMRQRDAFPSLASVKKIPIPAKCKKAKNNVKTR